MNPIDQIDAMLALCARATEGPWELGLNDDTMDRQVTADDEDTVVMQECRSMLRSDAEQRTADMAFIAASRTGWEATLRALRAAVEKLEQIGKGTDVPEGKSPAFMLGAGLASTSTMRCAAREALAKIAKELGNGEESR